MGRIYRYDTANNSYQNYISPRKQSTCRVLEVFNELLDLFLERCHIEAGGVGRYGVDANLHAVWAWRVVHSPAVGSTPNSAEKRKTTSVVFIIFFMITAMLTKAAFVSLVRAIRSIYTVNIHTVNGILVSLLTRKYIIFS